MSSSNLEELIEERIKIASTQTTSKDRVVHIAWLADGKDIWNKSNGKRGHSPAEARRYIISSVSRLIAEAETKARIDEHHKLDAALNLNMDIAEWSLHRESELTSLLKEKQ